MDIKMVVSGSLCEITPWFPELSTMLTYTRREFVDKYGRLSTTPEITRETMFSQHGVSSAMFPAGMLRRVKHYLISRGHSVTVEDRRPLAELMPTPDFTKVEKLRERQDAVLLAVASNTGGLLVGGTGVGKSFLIKQICLMYPTLRIMVVSPRKAVVNTLSGNLKEAFPAGMVGTITGDCNDGPDRRITVTTDKSMLKADMERCDLLLFDEVHNVGFNLVATAVASMTRARKFGFTATPDGRSDGADVIMEALFGPVLVDIPYTEAVDKNLVVPIEVHLYRVPGEMKFQVEGKMPVTRRRWAYWRHTERNKLIANIARRCGDEQVLIIVETLEHGMYLKQLLPEFLLVYASGSKADLPEEYRMSPKQLEQARKDFAAGKLRKAIATMTWKEGVDFKELSVLIRADAATSAILGEQIPGRLSRLAENKTVGVLVDFDDAYLGWALGRSRKRVKLYSSIGWKIIRKRVP